MSFSVIIPSRKINNLAACVYALRECEPNAGIIVVDDGLMWTDMIGTDTPVLSPVSRIPGTKPFVFARNVNLGIEAAGSDNVVILGDDALLKTHGGLSLLAQAAAEHPEYGVIASACNNVGNRNQERGVGLVYGLRQDPRMVCFICVYIPRRTIDAVGLLDERFGGVDAQGRTIYGWEDNDYCRRVRKAGLKIGIHDGCFVDHKTLPSTFRSGRTLSIQPGKDVYLAKWGSLE